MLFMMTRGRQAKQRGHGAKGVGTEFKISTASLPALGHSRHRCFCKPPELKVQVFLQQKRQGSGITGGQSSSTMSKEV